MNISIIDYIGIVKDGISILMSWVIDDDYFEFIFWFNKKHDYRIYASDDLLKKLEIVDINKWDQIENFIVYLNSIIPPKEEIFKEFEL